SQPVKPKSEDASGSENAHLDAIRQGVTLRKKTDTERKPIQTPQAPVNPLDRMKESSLLKKVSQANEIPPPPNNNSEWDD
ncbi:MAG: hypothetical protein B7X06_00765, partial [Verrucomicrobia bacterium 21-51-4]